MTGRGQANVVGVAVLLGLTVVALGALTAAVGTVVEEHAATADADRVAAQLDDAVQPVRATGENRGPVAFTDGRLHAVDRTVRVLNASGAVAVVDADALVFEAGDRGVVVLAGAILRRSPGGADMYRPPPITASRAGGVLVVGVAELNGSVGFAATGGGRTTLATTVSHDRSALGNGSYRVAVETATPGPWRRYFRRQNASLVGPRDFDGDGVDSVVARYPGRRVGYLVVHRIDLEVGDG